jgi:glycine cleavage system H lipoate-binding protein
MLTHEFLSVYPAKLAEYVLAVSYMVAFIGWWKFVNGGKRARLELAAEAGAAHAAEAETPAAAANDWFTVPEGFWIHPGHTWARAADDGSILVGLDDFAQKLVGPVAKLGLPRPGAPVAQGVAAFSLGADGKSVPMLSPVDGVVSEVNEHVATDPALLSDPYAQGWLFKVRPARFEANARQLLAGDAARAWMDAAAEKLAASASPELGRVLQDGGAPVSGIAQELEPQRWDELAKAFFLTSER